MKNLIYLISGTIFGLGLTLSGIFDPMKVKNFLAIGTAYWDPALIFILGAAVPVYCVAFFIIRRRQKTLNGVSFGHPAPRPIDKKLIFGSIIFGIGWGIAGTCPGPALIHLAYPETNFVIFVVMMFAGFELQGRLT